MATLKVKLVKSTIDRPIRQKRTVEALGLRKLHQVKEHEDSSMIRGMIRKVSHLVEVQEA